jgi:DNA-binding response OmpR family regulator
LVVDDEEALTGMIADFFRSEGFEVLTALNGVHGYACYFHHPTEWVVTDIQMPDLDGIEMMRCIRAINPSVKTIYVSGAVDRFRSVLEREIQQFGAIVLKKPFSVQELTRLATAGPADNAKVDLRVAV